jgi:3-methyladenine DNA glycosylase AlkD
MGTWGAESFENDDALDWLQELTSSDDVKLLRKALQEAVSSPEPLEAPEASAVVAAAELVAAALGRPAQGLPEETGEWIERYSNPEVRALASLARRAVRSIKDRSELRELWEEAGAQEWLAAIAALEARLQDPGSSGN